MLAGNILTEFTNLFSPNNFNKNDDIILRVTFKNGFYNSIMHDFNKTPKMNFIRLVFNMIWVMEILKI